MFPVKPRENVIPIESEIEKSFLEEVLKDHNIPHVFISYHDTAFDGLYQMQNGWGHVEVPREYIDHARRLYQEVRRSNSEVEQQNRSNPEGETEEESQKGKKQEERGVLPMITVSAQDEGTFIVEVSEKGGKSSHTVTLADDYHRKLTDGKVSKEKLIEKSFEFLLERESKESILGRFELPVISRYFPDYERKIAEMI